MEVVSLEQWKDAAAGASRLPYVYRHAPCPPPAAWEPYLATGEAILLESARDGRYTIFVPGPRRHTLLEAGVLEYLRWFYQDHHMPRFPGVPPFCGGLAGVLSYDVAREIERLPATATDDLHLPMAALAVADELFVYDLQQQCMDVIVVVAADGDLPEKFSDAAGRAVELYRDFLAQADTAATSADPPSVQPREPVLSLDQTGYIAAVERVKAYIAAGDSYQVNLSLRETRPLTAEPSAVYEALRRINPSPYMAYLPFAGWTLVCGSPELLVKSHAGRIEARPIAGTRPRGRSGDSDAALRGELLASPKERAEHLMLVDLIRNDLGRVCRYGSVEVSDFMVLEGYSHVQHIVSHVVGELDQRHDVVDLIASAFPGGTITGAPKVRTMEIIEELEPVRRGFYTGSAGWFSYTGDVELNIVIRTLLARDGLAHVQAGAGIVADSVPENEFDESLNKAYALWAALDQATRDHAALSR